MGQLGPRLRLIGQLGSEERVRTSFQIFSSVNLRRKIFSSGYSRGFIQYTLSRWKCHNSSSPLNNKKSELN